MRFRNMRCRCRAAKRRGHSAGAGAAIALAAVVTFSLVFPVWAGVPAKALSSVFPSGLWTGGSERKRNWSLGDTLTREIDGTEYRFRCIDENYSDEMEYHRPGALFLCDTVIPANFGSRYEFETPGDKEHGYVFDPGPIVNFGADNEYKYSAIRSWLKAAEPGVEEAEPVNTGVFRAYTGSTPKTGHSRFDGGTLTGNYMGSQKMTDRLFILSVDEALKYRDWLWRFEGAGVENPESQYGPFCKGYWLRSPVGTGENRDTGLVYIVDLVNGNIRPAPIAPAGAEGERKTEERQSEGNKYIAADAELQVTGTTGVRPAFVLPQN